VGDGEEASGATRAAGKERGGFRALLFKGSFGRGDDSFVARGKEGGDGIGIPGLERMDQCFTK